MKETLKQDLQSLRIEGNTAFLPSEPLQNYAELKKTLFKATGEYKKNTFVFPSPAQPIINKLLGGDIVDFKKEFQFFATDPKLASYIIDQIFWNENQVNILEPEAGHGVLIDEILTRNPNVKKTVDAVELSDLNFSVLQDKYKHTDNVNLIHGDFLAYNPSKKYDFIIANPPFTKNQDIDHIRHMWTLLKDGGQLITIASKSWTFGSQKKQKEFREWLDEIKAYYEDVEKGSFKSSGTMVEAMLIKADKPTVKKPVFKMQTTYQKTLFE